MAPSGRCPAAHATAGIGQQPERDCAADQQEEMDLQRPAPGKGLARATEGSPAASEGSISANSEAAAVHSTADSST